MRFAAWQDGEPQIRSKLSNFLFTVSDDIETGPLLVADSEYGRIILRLSQKFPSDVPQFARPTRGGNRLASLRSISQPGCAYEPTSEVDRTL